MGQIRIDIFFSFLSVSDWVFRQILSLIFPRNLSKPPPENAFPKNPGDLSIMQFGLLPNNSSPDNFPWIFVTSRGAGDVSALLSCYVTGGVAFFVSSHSTPLVLYIIGCSGYASANKKREERSQICGSSRTGISLQPLV